MWIDLLVLLALTPQRVRGLLSKLRSQKRYFNRGQEFWLFWTEWSCWSGSRRRELDSFEACLQEMETFHESLTFPVQEEELTPINALMRARASYYLWDLESAKQMLDTLEISELESDEYLSFRYLLLDKQMEWIKGETLTDEDLDLPYRCLDEKAELSCFRARMAMMHRRREKVDSLLEFFRTEEPSYHEQWLLEAVCYLLLVNKVDRARDLIAFDPQNYLKGRCELLRYMAWTLIYHKTGQEQKESRWEMLLGLLDRDPVWSLFLFRELCQSDKKLATKMVEFIPVDKLKAGWQRELAEELESWRAFDESSS